MSAGALVLGLEGIVAKDAKSPYVEGQRETWHWEKSRTKTISGRRKSSSTHERLHSEQPRLYAATCLMFSPEILHQHQIAFLVIEFRIEDPALIGGDAEPVQPRGFNRHNPLDP